MGRRRVKGAVQRGSLIKTRGAPAGSGPEHGQSAILPNVFICKIQLKMVKGVPWAIFSPLVTVEE